MPAIRLLRPARRIPDRLTKKRLDRLDTIAIIAVVACFLWEMERGGGLRAQ